MTQVVNFRRLAGKVTGVPDEGEREEIWCDGNLDLLAMPLASIVGTRDVSPEGTKRTKKLASILVNEGFCIVSGLAKGVDRVAHETALNMDGHTIAVMGTPIDECYPSEHLELKQQVACRGLVLSQFAPGTPVRRGNFPQRNVLMAKLSSVTFVVEAGIDSGTKHQVRAAVRLGKKVAFLASLVNQDYPWVREALDSGLGFVIEQPEDARSLLRHANIQSAPPTPSVTQGNFDLFEQFADESGVNITATNTPPVEQGTESLFFVSDGIPEEEQVDLALISSSAHPQPSRWEKVWSWLLGIMPHRKA